MALKGQSLDFRFKCFLVFDNDNNDDADDGALHTAGAPEV